VIAASIAAVDQMRRLQRPCRYRGAGGAGFGEQMRIGDELRRRREFPPTLYALAIRARAQNPRSATFVSLPKTPVIGATASAPGTCTAVPSTSCSRRIDYRTRQAAA
jgi:hypothetical protein